MSNLLLLSNYLYQGSKIETTNNKKCMKAVSSRLYLYFTESVARQKAIGELSWFVRRSRLSVAIHLCLHDTIILINTALFSGINEGE